MCSIFIYIKLVYNKVTNYLELYVFVLVTTRLVCIGINCLRHTLSNFG